MSNNEITTRFQLSSLNGIISISNVTATPNPSGFIIEAKGTDIMANVKAVLDYVYDDHGYFTEGYCVVRRGDRYGIVNLCLQKRVDTIYQSINDVHETYAVAVADGKYRYIQMEGYSVPNVKNGRFDDASDICNGMGVVKMEGKFGLFSTAAGNVVLPCEYEDVKGFSLYRDYTAVKKDGLWGLVNKKGEWILEPAFDTISFNYNANTYTASIGDVEYEGGPDGTYQEK